MNKLPTRVILDNRGLDIGSVLCPICRDDVETTNHLFFSCPMAFDLWEMVARWWDIDVLILSSMADWVEWIDGVQVQNSIKDCLEALCLIVMWHIWNYRNNFLFGKSTPRKSTLWDCTQFQIFW